MSWLQVKQLNYQAIKIKVKTMSTFPPKNFENEYNEQMRDMHGENQKHESPATTDANGKK
ncbi:MAG: hypothetical protein ACRC2L_14940 [Serratia nevei]